MNTNGLDLKSESKESDLISVSTYSENENKQGHEPNRNNEEWRATTPGPKHFSIGIKLESWEIKPLHLDATGSVRPRESLLCSYVDRNGKKHAITSCECELITNQHSIHTLTYWLMETLRALRQITSSGDGLQLD